VDPMSLKKELISLASSQGANLVAVARPNLWGDYVEEARARLQETGASEEDCMLSEDAMTFFEKLRTYAYYPVVRQIAERVAAFITEAGYQAIQGQHIPLKYVAHEIGLGTYGWNGLLLTGDFGSYVALRAVVTDAELEPDTFEPPEPPCKDCGRIKSTRPCASIP